MSKEGSYTYLTDGARDWGNGIIGPSLADELYSNYFLDHTNSARPNLKLLWPIAGLALTSCATEVKAPDNPAMVQAQAQNQDWGWQFPFLGRGYFTGGGGGAHGEHLDFSVAAGVCQPGIKLVARNLPIKPIAPGVVSLVGDENNPHDPNHSMVKINHPNGYSSEYEHLAEIKVKKGQEVTYESDLGFTSCEHTPQHSNSGPHVDVVLIKDGQTIPFNENQPISGWVQHTLPGDRNGTLAKPGEETRVANYNWCNEANKNSSACHDTINYIDANLDKSVKQTTLTITPIAAQTSTTTPNPTPILDRRAWEIQQEATAIAKARPDWNPAQIAIALTATAYAEAPARATATRMAWNEMATAQTAQEERAKAFKDQEDLVRKQKEANSTPTPIEPITNFTIFKGTGYEISYPTGYLTSKNRLNTGQYVDSFLEITKNFTNQIMISSAPAEGSLDDYIKQIAPVLNQDYGSINTDLISNEKRSFSGHEFSIVRTKLDYRFMPMGPQELTLAVFWNHGLFDKGTFWAFMLMNDPGQTSRVLPTFYQMLGTFKTN